MRIAIVGQKGIPARTGGIERHVEELAIRLANDGLEVDVYTRPHFTDKKNKQYKGVRLISLPSIATKHLDAISHTFLVALHLAVVNRKVDIIHFQSIGPSILIPLVKILKPFTPIISTFHSQCYFHQKWGFFARWLLKIGEYFCIKWSDQTIAVSRGLKKYARKVYDEEVKYIPNGVPDYSGIKAQKIFQKWNLSKNDYVFVASRLIAHKGITLLIEAFSQLNIQKKLVIAGDGPVDDFYVKEVRRLADQDERVVLVGNQSGQVLAELYSNCRLFVQPSEREGLSIALLEAMSYELPILSSDIKENEEALADGGYYFKNKSVDDLREKLEKLLLNEELSRSRTGVAKKRVAQKYNWSVITQETKKAYKSLISEKESTWIGKWNCLWHRITNIAK